MGGCGLWVVGIRGRAELTGKEDSSGRRGDEGRMCVLALVQSVELRLGWESVKIHCGSICAMQWLV